MCSWSTAGWHYLFDVLSYRVSTAMISSNLSKNHTIRERCPSALSMSSLRQEDRSTTRVHVEPGHDARWRSAGAYLLKRRMAARWRNRAIFDRGGVPSAISRARTTLNGQWWRFKDSR